jgi:hypothetical protein
VAHLNLHIPAAHCAVDETARLTTTNARPDFQAAASDNGWLSAEVEFVVDTAAFRSSGASASFAPRRGRSSKRCSR